ncbi:MAG: glycosyltransferase family 4 protein [Planctomycetota bacterium]|jgi:glycosyltransferase involved in cell wall biosynthesis
MRIVQITPGTGGSFYCDNCLRDVALVKALRKKGHEVLMIPMYLPVQTNKDEVVDEAPIFFGGINVYLQQKFGFFRKTPRWVGRLLDSPRLLRWVGRKAEMTSARDLGQTTISMLQGEQGRQAKELDRFVEWLDAPDNKPDIVLLSNILLGGLAGSIKTRLGVPVLCFLQDEDGFLDGLAEPYAKQAWEMVMECSEGVDAFISVSKYYANVMRERLRLRADRVHVVYLGISLDEYEVAKAEPEVPTVGFLSRMCYNKGLDILVEAFINLKKNERLKNARLLIAGGKNRSDEVFINRIQQQLRACGLINDVQFLPDFDQGTKVRFLQTLSVLSVPEKGPVAYGLYLLEALAAGVPVVAPASGALPELLEMTGGGVLCEPNNAGALSAALEPLLLDQDYGRQLGKQGKEVVFARFNVDETAEELVRLCEETIQGFVRR